MIGTANGQAQEAVVNSQIRMLCVACVLAIFTVAAAQASPAPQVGNTANGQKVFTAQKCETCHGLKGEGGAGDAGGPQIAPPPVALPAFIGTVRNPKDPMPAFTAQQVSDAELTDVFAFLKSLGGTAPAQSSAAPTGAGNAVNGKKLYVMAGCYECHDNEGQGGAGTGPRLAPPIGFAAFIHQLRSPSDEMPPYTAKVLTDADVTDIYAFLGSVPKAPALASIPLLK